MLRSLACLALTGLVHSQDYPRMDEEMNGWGYTYTTHIVTTEDDYELSMFRITGDSSGAFTPDKPPVVIVHGSGMDGANWLSTIADSSSAKPWQLMLADAGYDVFIANNRGTEYSQNHVTLSAASDESTYWAWGWDDMGLYDDKAFIENAVHISATFEKAFYVGYSQGTSQMLYSLAHLEDSFHQYYTYKFLAYAPCFKLNDYMTMDQYIAGIDQFDEYGVYSFNGPNNDANVNTICANLDTESCEFISDYESFGESTKSQKLYIQGVLSGQMQEYMADFSATNIQGTLVDTDSISTVPITAFIGNDDQVCGRQQAEDHLDRMTTDVKKHYFNRGHGFFATMNGQDYYDLIECELQIPDGPSTCFGCFLRDSKMILAGIALTLGLLSF